MDNVIEPKIEKNFLKTRHQSSFQKFKELKNNSDIEEQKQTTASQESAKYIGSAEKIYWGKPR